MVSFSLLTSRERTRCDWLLAGSLDLLTIAWVGLLIGWWIG